MRRPAGAGAVAMAIALSAGCGATDVAQDVTPESIAQAADNTIATKGMRVTITDRISLPDGRSVPMHGNGVMDVKGRRGRVSFDLSKLASGPASAKLKPSDLRFDAVFDRFVIYMHSPLFARAKAFRGKSWMKIDVAKATKQQLGVDLGSLSGPSTSDPAQYLDYLRAASGNVRKLGTEKVAGVQTVHYRATLDLRKVVDQAPAADRAQARAGVARLIKEAGSATMPSEVWVDTDRHLVRRLRTSIPFKSPGGAQAKIEQTEEFSDFGLTVAIRTPPASDVFDATKLAGRRLGETK